MRLSRNARFLVECLDLPTATEVDNAKWEQFQIDHLNSNALFRIESKSRQIAWSFTVAAEAIANAMLEHGSSVFVSINQSEAAEKIRYAKRVYEHLNIGGLPTLVRDHVMGIEFSNGARIMSLPSRPPRGKAKMNVILDEFAHVANDREIYTAALPIISKGGRLRIGSSPLGATGVFWEIAKEELRLYPGYEHIETPWWHVRAFRIGRLPLDARGMVTEQRVARYGNRRIRDIYENMPLDNFQQEYEVVYVDESVSWITWALIRRNQDKELVCWQARNIDQALEYIPAFLDARMEGHVENILVGGVDIGRKKHLTEIVLVGKGPTHPVRFTVSLDRVEYDAQAQLLRRLLNQLPITSLLIDSNGIGNQLAEDLARDTVAEGVTFTNATKELWAVEAKLELERGIARLPVDRDLAYQIHSLKKRVTAAKNNVFDVDKTEKHHADKFWAWALALWAAHDSLRVVQYDTVPAWRR